MRIRKNANHSSLAVLSQTAGTGVLQTHVCQLNQSPWDLTPFNQEPFQSYFHQYEGLDSLNGNGSLEDSIGAVESSSVASIMDIDPPGAATKTSPKKREEELINIEEDNYEVETTKFKKGNRVTKMKNNGKGWHSNKNNEPKEESESLSDQLNSTEKDNASPSKKADKSSSGGGGAKRPSRAKAGKKGQSSLNSNPYEFYYYSGFGPSWGKRRGDRCESKDAEKNDSSTIIDYEENTTPFSTPSPVERINDLFDFMEEDDDYEDSENGDFGKKRMRKPVKARSLKSLM